MDLDDLDLVHDLTHPVRGAVLRRLKHPRTVADVAELMDVPVTRLYHHVNKLADLGLIRVVATRQVAAVTERRYQVVAKSFGLDPKLLNTFDDREMAIALGSIFDVAKTQLLRTIEAGAFHDLTSDPDSTLSLSEIHLSTERLHELVQRLDGIIKEFSSDLDDNDPEATTVTLFIAAFPDSG
jgi:DNA-binding transcriptional ArsR family regulator